MNPWTSNRLADEFIKMLWAHDADAGDARDTKELLGYAASSLVLALKREGLAVEPALKAAKDDAAWLESGSHGAITPCPGNQDPEPEPPTFDEALGFKRDREAEIEQARKLR